MAAVRLWPVLPYPRAMEESYGYVKKYTVVVGGRASVLPETKGETVGDKINEIYDERVTM